MQKGEENIIFDDSFSDDTIPIIKKIQLQFPLIQLVVNKTKLGAVKNFEKCIYLTKGDFIFLSDQDDIWLPEKVQICVSALRVRKKSLLVFTDGLLIDEQGTLVSGKQT